MPIPDRDEIDKRIGWHINALIGFLNDIRDEADVRATILNLLLVVDGSARVVRQLDIRVAPNMPGIAKLEKQLGLRPPGGSEGYGASE
jgi:hypothetical protein